MSVVQEFKEFALKGNVVDLAVGIIIGGAFGNIVNSAVGDLVMPLVGRVVGRVDFKSLYLPLSTDVPWGMPTLEAAKAKGPVLAYGSFLTIALNFFILAFAVFLLVKAINTARNAFHHEAAAKAAAAPPPPPPPPSAEEKLLVEIRDLLKTKV